MNIATSPLPGGEDVEIAGGVAGLQFDVQLLAGAGAHLIVDVVIALDLPLDNRRGRTLGEMDGLAAGTRIGGRCNADGRLHDHQHSRNR